MHKRCSELLQVIAQRDANLIVYRLLSVDTWEVVALGFGQENSYVTPPSRLEKDGEKLSGWAHPHFDAVKLIPRTAHVVARRIACDAR